MNGKIYFFYMFPPLSECRSALLERLPGLDVTWDLGDLWAADPYTQSSDGERDDPF
jgi:hypothetical protein